MGLRRLLWRRRDEQGAASAEADAARFADGVSATPPDSGAGMDMVIVLHPNGTQTRTSVGREPVTLGNSEQMTDIAIEDSAFRTIHMRITPFVDGEFRVHGLERPPVRPFATNLAQPAEFVLASSGDNVTLTGDRGEYVIHFFSSEAVLELDWGTSTSPPRPIALTEAGPILGHAPECAARRAGRVPHTLLRSRESGGGSVDRALGEGDGCGKRETIRGWPARRHLRYGTRHPRRVNSVAGGGHADVGEPGAETQRSRHPAA